MTILNIGSINVDHVYHVDHFVQPGETLQSTAYSQGLGGKGLNQSIALHRAGAAVVHLGAVGAGDAWTLAQIEATGIATHSILRSQTPTGHAIIQVNAAGQNCIVLYAGANQTLTRHDAESAIQTHCPTWLLLQNETSLTQVVFDLAKAYDIPLAYNPAPVRPEHADLPLEQLALLLVNEVEATQLTACDTVEAAFAHLRKRCPNTLIVMTLGADGLCAAQGDQTWRLPAVPTTVVDTTAAGDTITGYVLAGLAQGLPVDATLHQAAKAAAITVSRAGAASSIPFAAELAA